MSLAEGDEADGLSANIEMRAPLAAGDPITWSVLVAGTSMEGLSWPGWGSVGWDSPIFGGSRS